MPVDVVSGVLFTAAHDAELWGTAPLIFRRTYSSDRIARPPSVLGRAWLHAFEVRLIRDVDGFRFLGHDGAEVAFDGTDEDLARGETLRNLASFMELRLEEGRLVVWHWHGWQGPVQRFVFHGGEDVMLLAAIQTPASHSLNCEYDAKGRLQRVEQSVERRSLLFEYDPAGLLGRLSLGWPGIGTRTLPVAVYEYDNRQRLVRVTDALGAAAAYEYDERDRLVSERSRSGSVALMKYDAQGRCEEMGGSDGAFRRVFRYEPTERRTVVEDSLGNLAAHHYNDAGQIEKIVDPGGAVSTNQFDELGRVVAATGALAPEGLNVAVKFDERGDTVEMEFAGGKKRRLEYDENHQITAIHDVTGAVWKIRYERGAVTAVEDPLGAVSRCVRDENNAIAEAITPWGNRIRFERDRQWQHEKFADGVGLIVAQEYDIFLHPLRIDDAGGQNCALQYDALGRLVRIATPDGGRREFGYTPGGQLAGFRDARGGTTRFSWSPWANCTKTTDANDHAHEFDWDTEGRLLSVRNPKRERAAFVYDAAGNLIEQRFFDGRTERYGYDAAGHLIWRERADGTKLEFKNNEAGDVLSIAVNGEPLMAFAYDPAGRVIGSTSKDGAVSLEYDACGRIVSEMQHGAAIRYTYGPHGGVVRREFEGSLAGPLQIDYDVRGRLRAFRNQLAVLEEFQYDARDLVTQRTMAGVREKLEYDYAGRVLRQEVGGPLLKPSIVRQYRYDLGGGLIAVTDSRGRNSSYDYDPGERLTSAEVSGAAERYEYDLDGNLIRRDGLRLTYGAGDRLEAVGSAPVESDAAGNPLGTGAADRPDRYEWDALDRLVAVHHADGSTTRYGYDGFGRRLFKDRAGLRTEFFWAGNDLLAERTGASITEYAIDEFWPHMIWRDGEPLHAIVSPLGLICELVDARGSLVWSGAYDAWGRLAAGNGSAAAPPLRLRGQYFDAETGLHYNRCRYYDPRTGRFISPDPIGFCGGPNVFLYAPNPVNYDDPLGLICGAKTSGQSVYVLTKNGRVVYVGITDQLPHARLSDHRNNKATGSFDHMQVIATGLTNRREARNIEGSLLYHIYQSQQPNYKGPPITVAGMPVASKLLNAERDSNPGYWHSYTPGSPSMGQDGRTLLTPSQIDQQAPSSITKIQR